jgi:glycosyltransferase involved in cell wall biosynthesis
MTIGIDIRVLAKGTRTGIEEYVLNLLPRLLPLDKKVKYKLFYNAFRKVELDYPWLNLPNVELCEFKIPNRLFFASARYLGQPKIDRFLKGIDIYFNPHFFVAPVSSRCRKIITFHDLSFEHHSQLFSYRKILWQKFLMNTRQEARKADKIMADSFSTKEDLVKIYKIDPTKIEVVYLGASKDFKLFKPACQQGRKDNPQLKKVRKKYNLPRSFILYFGTIEPRKNLILVIKAFEALKEECAKLGLKTTWKGFERTIASKQREPLADLKLVIAGAKGWLYKDIFEKVKNSKYKEDIIFTGFIDDKDKPYLYNLANIFVYPSFFEGFGFPPLEAMACGTPTIVSNASSLPEIVGNGAIMIDPYNVDELTFAIRKVLEDKDLQSDLIKKGLKQAKKFNWDKTAKEVLGIFKDL